MDSLKSIAHEFDSKSAHSSRLSWVHFTTGIDCGVDDAEAAMIAVLENKEYFEQIKSVAVDTLSEDDQRRHRLMYKMFEPYHFTAEVNALSEKINKKTTELAGILNKHRSQFEGQAISSVELNQILSKDSDRERRKAAYMAKNQVNQPLLEGGFLELVQMRKELARLLGKESFVALKLEEDELSPDLFKNWKAEVKAMLPQMKALREKYAQQFLNDSVIMPWDESYIAGKIAPSLNEKTDMTRYYNELSDFFKGFGIDITTMNITYDVFARANKSEWGYNFPIQTGVDSRILANVKDQYNEYGVLLHETGHAVHSFLTDPEDVMMNLGISGIISEGIANLFGGFLTDELFYKRFFNTETVSDEFTAIRDWWKLNAFRSIHRILFDQGFYTESIESQDDIEAMYWKLSEELFEEQPFCENPPWAFLIHHTTHPIYLHNYFMGDVTCGMLKSVFNKKYGTQSVSEKPELFGEFLKENIIQPAGRMPYPELFKHISGEAFSLNYLK